MLHVYTRILKSKHNSTTQWTNIQQDHKLEVSQLASVWSRLTFMRFPSGEARRGVAHIWWRDRDVHGQSRIQWEQQRAEGASRPPVRRRPGMATQQHQFLQHEELRIKRLYHSWMGPTERWLYIQQGETKLPCTCVCPGNVRIGFNFPSSSLQVHKYVVLVLGTGSTVQKLFRGFGAWVPSPASAPIGARLGTCSISCTSICVGHGILSCTYPRQNIDMYCRGTIALKVIVLSLYSSLHLLPLGWVRSHTFFFFNFGAGRRLHVFGMISFTGDEPCLIVKNPLLWSVGFLVGSWLWRRVPATAEVADIL